MIAGKQEQLQVAPAVAVFGRTAPSVPTTESARDESLGHAQGAPLSIGVNAAAPTTACSPAKLRWGHTRASCAGTHASTTTPIDGVALAGEGWL